MFLLLAIRTDIPSKSIAKFLATTVCLVCLSLKAVFLIVVYLDPLGSMQQLMGSVSA